MCENSRRSKSSIRSIAKPAAHMNNGHNAFAQITGELMVLDHLANCFTFGLSTLLDGHACFCLGEERDDLLICKSMGVYPQLSKVCGLAAITLVRFRRAGHKY